MVAPAVVEPEISGNPKLQVPDRLVAFQVDIFVFESSPEPLDIDVISPAATPVHTDLNTGVFEYLDEAVRGELASLVGVEDCRDAMIHHRFLQGLDAEIGFHGLGDSPTENLPAVKIHDGHQVDMPTAEAK